VNEVTIKLINYHPAQAAIVNSPARFKVVDCGRRFGKSLLLQDILCDHALDQPFPYGLFTPTYKMLRESWDGLKNILAPIIKKTNEQEKRLELITGAIIDGWSLENNDSVRGRAYKLVAIDEAAMIPNLQYAWENVIFPTLADYQGGAIFASTPKGLNYFYQLYNRGLDPQFPDWASFHFPTSSNPSILPSELDMARQLLPELTWKQEYEAEFVADAAMVFRGVRECIQPPSDNPRGPVVFGVDWGKSNDYTVIIAIDTYTNHMIAIDRFNQISWELQRGRLKAMADRFRPVSILAEENSIGGPNIEALQGMGLPVIPFTTTNASKGHIIDSLALAFEQRRIGILDDPILIGELQAYEMERLPGGAWRYNAPSGGHDDTVMALALAWEATGRGANKLTRLRRAGPPNRLDEDD